MTRVLNLSNQEALLVGFLGQPMTLPQAWDLLDQARRIGILDTLESWLTPQFQRPVDETRAALAAFTDRDVLLATFVSLEERGLVRREDDGTTVLWHRIPPPEWP